MSFRLEYDVGEAGWATCRVRLGQDVVEMTASYLHNSLDQLCDVVASVARGAQAGSVIFMNEPGEHHLNLQRVGEADVLVQIVWHDDWTSWGMGSASSSQMVVEGTTAIAVLRDQTYAMALHILDSLGPSEYRRRWVEHDFPEASFARLRDARS